MEAFLLACAFERALADDLLHHLGLAHERAEAQQLRERRVACPLVRLAAILDLVGVGGRVGNGLEELRQRRQYL